ncbi:MAG: hypothetical protein QM662_16220 [Gordonia sp. (in: high G+C Gram-positive bacteria)]
MADDPHTCDLNGRPVGRSRRERLAARLGRRRVATGLTVDDPALTLIVQSTDDAVSSATALASSTWRPGLQIVLRHVLSLPPARVAAAVEVAALDRYTQLPAQTGPKFPGVHAGLGRELVVLARVQELDALHLSQERSRMASLGSRHGGSALGWQVLGRDG